MSISAPHSYTWYRLSTFISALRVEGDEALVPRLTPGAAGKSTRGCLKRSGQRRPASVARLRAPQQAAALPIRKRASERSADPPVAVEFFNYRGALRTCN